MTSFAFWMQSPVSSETEVCGISCITNLAAGLSGKELSHQEVQETADRVAQQFQSLVWELLSTVEA